MRACMRLRSQPDFAGLAVTEANLALAVANYRQRGKAELATALDDLGHSIDCNELLDSRRLHPSGPDPNLPVYAPLSDSKPFSRAASANALTRP